MKPSLYDLQSQWDDERAHLRARALRRSIAPQVRADLRWLPVLLPLLVGAAALLAAMLP